MKIDYGELKRRVWLHELLARIGWTSTEGRGEQLRGPCPFPACSANLASANKARRRTFSVHRGKSVYRCFSCGCSGNALEFWQAYRGISLYEAALELVQILETSNHTSSTSKPPPPQHHYSQPAKMVDS